jgi:inosose dehydratase
MKIGLSTYSLLPAIKSGEMSVLDVIRWIAGNGGEHMEIVPYGFTLVDNPELADAVRKESKSAGIELSNYSMPANFVQETEEAFEAEVMRIKEHVDLVARLGMMHMRHDVTAFTIPPEQMTIGWLEKSLPLIVQGSRLIADYATNTGSLQLLKITDSAFRRATACSECCWPWTGPILERRWISAISCAWMNRPLSELRRICLMLL